MKLYVVRHCSTVRSEQKIFCGSTDLPLSPRGEEEAKALFLRAKALSPDVVFSSPLLRARQTAEVIAGDAPVFLDERLRERDFGDFEGTDCSRPDGTRYRCNMGLKYPNGESYLDVFARIRPLLDEIGTRFAGKTVCLVTHGSVCRVLRALCTEMTDADFYAYSQPNGTVEEYNL